jgi:hypothetical protein
MEKFTVDARGNVVSSEVGVMNLNVTHRNDVLLLTGAYEKSGFGMTEHEKHVAVLLREQGCL